MEARSGTLILKRFIIELPYSKIGRTIPLKAASFTFWGQEKRVRLKKPRVLLALVQILLICVFNLKSFVIVHNRAARFVTRNYVYETGSMTGILGQLKWESLKKRRKDNRLILLYKGLKGKARIPTDDLIPKTRRGRNQHSLAFQIPSASKDVYQHSFFPQTIKD